jgi:hypothetical protein
MNSILKNGALATAIILVLAGANFAGEGPTSSSESDKFVVRSRVRFEYDDNIYERSTNKVDSFKIEVEPEFIYNLNLDQTYVGFRYRPTFVWWSDREPDDTDLHHNFNFDFTHNISPRLSLSVKDAFLYSNEPQLMDRGVVIAVSENFIYNLANADLTYQMAPKTRLTAGGRYTLLRYDNNLQQKANDYDIYSGGLSLRQDVTAATALIGEYRAESISYDQVDRGSMSHYLGGGIESSINPNLVASVRGGAQYKQFDSDTLDSRTSPYVDGSLTYLPRPDTRVTVGAGYSMFEADIYPFANQDRLLAYISLGQDLTARLSVFLTGSYQISDYSGDQSIDQKVQSKDGSEDVAQFTARASYKVNNRNWIEANYEYINLNSDFRDEFDRNRVSVGWRTNL